jgi:hypothetical protein
MKLDHGWSDWDALFFAWSPNFFVLLSQGVSTLVDGFAMLCTTCYSPHGGNYNYILREDVVIS